VTYTEGAKASVDGDVAMQGWSSRLAPGAPVYYEDHRPSVPVVSFKEQVARPASVPTGVGRGDTHKDPNRAKTPWDLDAVQGSRRGTGRMRRPQCASQMLSDRRWRNAPPASYDIDGDGFINQRDLEISMRLDNSRSGLKTAQLKDGRHIVAKELWEQQRAQHTLGKSPLNAAQRREKMDQLLGLREEPNGSEKFVKQLALTQTQRMEEVQHGSAGVISCVCQPQAAMSGRIPQHPTPTRMVTRGAPRRAKTRTELLEGRVKDMKSSIGAIQKRSFTGGEFPRYDGNVLDGNKRMRELIKTHDQCSFRRQGGAFKEDNVSSKAPFIFNVKPK